MKKILSILALFILTLSAVTAQAAAPRGLKPSEECAIYCQSTDPVVKWEWTGDGFVEDPDWTDPGYILSITGDESNATWQADPSVDCVVSKHGLQYVVHEGGLTGEVLKTEHDTSHITLCGDDNSNDVPEFTTIGLGITILGIAGVMFIYKKRH